LEVASITLCLSRLAAQKPDPAIVSNTDSIALTLLHAVRGLLIHRLELRRGWVYDYRIVAAAGGTIDQRSSPCVLYNLMPTDSHA
jgi:hypothetical protein